MIVNFLKSLVSPIRMAKYRYMSALLAVLIFVLSAYLLAIPYGKELEKSVYAFKDDYNFLPLQEMIEENSDNEAIVNEIIALGCSVNEGVLECTNYPTDLAEGEIFERQLVYVKDGITKKINVFVDLSEEPKHPTNVGFDLEDYPYVDNEEQYFLLFQRETMLYQAHQVGIDKEEETHLDQKLQMVGLSFDYKQYMPELNLNVDADNFGSYITDLVIKSYAKYMAGSSFLATFVVCVFFPLMMVTLFWLFFKRTGRLTKYKEYYNIAAIASIIPIVIVFALIWVLPAVMNWYIFVFSLYYFVILFKINNSPELV